jgi:hypothetical protein
MAAAILSWVSYNGVQTSRSQRGQLDHRRTGRSDMWRARQSAVLADQPLWKASELGMMTKLD